MNRSKPAQPCKKQGPSRRHGGFTLIELLISMALGIVVIGAAMVLYSSGATATRFAIAQGQMNEDASMALSALTQGLRKAGYNPRRPAPVVGSAVNDLGQAGWSIGACATDFTDRTVLQTGALTCTGAPAPNTGALAVVHEADLVSGKNTAAGLPMDCIGNGVVAEAAASLSGGSYYTMQSRFYIENNALMCLGSGGALPRISLNQVPQALAENIESMSFMFGIGSPADNKIVQGYYSPVEINGAPADAAFAALTVAQRYDKVVAVRVCVVVRSENAILNDTDTAPTYLDCDDNSAAINDGRLRRAYRTTVLLRNHGVGYDN